LLGEAGIKNVRALLGGWNAWLNASYPTARGDDPK
jgi:3-mercaptopyruvate sulfurtransferase SseA